MSRKSIVCLLPALLLLGSGVTPAQQVPYLNELFSRFENFSNLYKEKQKAGANLTTIEALKKRGEEAFKRGNIPGILEALGEGVAVLQGKPWDERQRFISSLTLETDKLVIEPNTDLQVNLVRMFPSDTAKAFSKPPTVTFEIVEADDGKQPGPSPAMQKLSKPLPIADHLAVGEASSGAGRRLLVADGAYFVVARVEAGETTVAELRRPVFAISGFSDSIAQLSNTIAAIRNASDAKVRAVSALVTTPEFQLGRLSVLTKTRGEEELNPIREMDRVEAVLSQLASGQNPFAGERGEIERAYKAPDGALIPYRLYVPGAYDAASPRPLVVLLHGALGDEHYYFSGLFDPAVIKGEAERRGWILVGVNGRGRFGGYRGLSLEDSFEVINAVTRDYKIDSSRIYLTGHSMGGFGTWTVAAAKPGLFAAIAPVSGGAPAQGEALNSLLAQLKHVPALVVHGARDGIVPPERSKEMVQAARKAGLEVSYLESPASDHISIVGATFPAILAFFEKNQKPMTEK